MKFVIEKIVKQTREVELPNKFKYPFSQMEIGESFNAGEYNRGKSQKILVSAHVWCRQQKNGWKFSGRKEIENGKTISRVYRIPNNGDFEYLGKYLNPPLPGVIHKHRFEDMQPGDSIIFSNYNNERDILIARNTAYRWRKYNEQNWMFKAAFSNENGKGVVRVWRIK